MNFFIITFGCKVNQYETQLIFEKLCAAGCTKSESFKDADIIVINSCTVTHQSDKKVKKFLNKVRKENKKAIVVLVGCMPQAFQENMNFIDEADIILGNYKKSNIFEHVLEFIKKREKIIKIENLDSKSKFESELISNFSQRTRAFLKIEDGCNRFCSYCIIPYARGRVRSKSIQEILTETKNLSKNGFNEIVLVGINLSAYGSDLGLGLCDAVEKVCSVNGIERVRLGSLEPEYLNKSTIERLAKQKKLCPHFHISLQSGCNATLKRMNRHYTAEEYLEIVGNLRSCFKNVSITTDVMVGFPGESEDEFEESLNFVKKVEFSKIHVFAYSMREGTLAAKFKNQVSFKDKKIRSEIMLNQANKTHTKFLNSQVEKIEPVLFEKRDSNGFWEGYTPNYTPVKTRSNLDLHSKIISTKIIKNQSNYCLGTILIQDG